MFGLGKWKIGTCLAEAPFQQDVLVKVKSKTSPFHPSFFEIDVGLEVNIKGGGGGSEGFTNLSAMSDSFMEVQ